MRPLRYFKGSIDRRPIRGVGILKRTIIDQTEPRTACARDIHGEIDSKNDSVRRWNQNRLSTSSLPRRFKQSYKRCAPAPYNLLTIQHLQGTSVTVALGFWRRGTFPTKILHTYTNTGFYTVTAITNSNGCKRSASIGRYIRIVVGSMWLCVSATSNLSTSFSSISATSRVAAHYHIPGVLEMGYTTVQIHPPYNAAEHIQSNSWYRVTWL
jgi:hypothetical protein